MSRAYLGIVDTGKGLRGGVLVLSEENLPEDFFYTERVSPTRLQRALYGPRLDHHIRSGLIAETLLEKLESAPELLVVDDERLLQPEGFRGRVVKLSPSSHEPLGDAGEVEETANGKFLIQTADYGSPLEVTLPGEGDESAAERVAEILVRAAEHGDPFEPTERVRKLLAIVDEESGQ